MGAQCPGYARVFKFQDEAPALKQRYRAASKASSRSSTASSSAALALSRSSPSSEEEDRPGCRDDRRREADDSLFPHPRLVGRTNVRYKPVLLSIDEGVSPSLAVQAISAQQTQIYANYVLTAWPCLFKCTETQVPINWVQFVSSRGSGLPRSPFDAIVRCITCTYMGLLHDDQRLVDIGRFMYIKALRMVAARLTNLAAAKSDEVVATAILLSVYDMSLGTTADAWLKHSAGIAELMRLRGPEAHIGGFGRAIYIAFRGFLVTAALLNGEACFLERPEWQQLSETIGADNAKQPDSSLFTDIAERAFREIVKLPGFVKRVQDLWELPAKKQAQLRPALVQNITACRATLRGIHTEFGIAVATQGSRSSSDGSEQDSQETRFIGPIPYDFFDGFASLSIKGIRSGIILLNQLLMILTPEDRPALKAEIRSLSPGSMYDRCSSVAITTKTRTESSSSPSSSSSLITPPPDLPPSGVSKRAFPLKCESLMTPELRLGPTTPWVDSIATSMGMGGVRFSVIEEEEEYDDKGEK
ncbi:hypothetical protein T310_7970 [Rasamsonia emersonii CBS 393.64]|uniref:C6 finger domain protein n=1 Tax=Rasamsonia emersonii (strain ATCC 16479 / CBS 393.64 / IMI 116815) TaxID=1408163 RepID=A0A0F4YJM7_RASE3|nr:hypothetical protein T310_7970 [Rasamsonia emersonii CBS 393.64]KKA18086.1 hypothetical protein T310_7970 [Rasamsonia emersonii CBS 393.64]